MNWKKIMILGLFPFLQNSLSVSVFCKNHELKILKNDIFQERDEKYLKLSNLFIDDEMFVFHKKNFLKDESDHQLLNDLEQFLFTPASKVKSEYLQQFINQSAIFDSYRTLSDALFKKEYVVNNSKNKYFNLYADVNLDKIFYEIPQSYSKVWEDAKKVVLQVYNFLIKIMDTEQLSKLILNLSIDSRTDRCLTTLFPKTASLAVLLDKYWWDVNRYAAKNWKAVKMSGSTFAHEMGHVISFFTSYSKGQHALFNSTNIEKISNHQKIETPISREKLVEITKSLNSSKDILVANPKLGVAPKFADYIFEKAINLLNEEIKIPEEKYSMVQPIHCYLMILSALIPSNYARESIIKYGSELFASRGVEEFWAEAFSYLLLASDNEKNIFWEWTYDFVISEQKLKTYF